MKNSIQSDQLDKELRDLKKLEMMALRSIVSTGFPDYLRRYLAIKIKYYRLRQEVMRQLHSSVSCSV